MINFFRSLAVGMAILLTFASAEALAQNGSHEFKHPSDANIIGHVVEATSGEHIPGATIQIKGTVIGTATDQSGHYFLANMRPGQYTLVMRAVGYRMQERTINVEKDKTLEVNFEAEEDVVNMDGVVVTANRNETIRRLAPTVVGVIDTKVFSTVNANNLLQSLSFQPGLRVENNCQNCNFNQVRINGLDGKYSQILIDSRPIFSALAGVYGIEQIPTSMVERIEVIRGGGSALYGSTAIGGVINIITKQPKGNSAEVHESLSLTGLKKVDNNFSFNASVVSNDARSGAIFFGNMRNRSPWDANGDDFSELGKLEDRSFGVRGFVKTSDLSQLTAEIHTIKEYRRGGDHIDYPDHVAQVSERVDHSVYSGNLKFDLFSRNQKHHFTLYSSAQKIRRDSYYGGIGSWDEVGENPEETVGLGNPVSKENYGENYGVTRGLTINAGTQYTYDMDNFLFMPAQILAGVEYVYDHLNDATPIRQWNALKDESGKLIKDKDGKMQEMFPTTDQKIHNFSQFAQIEWKNEMFSVLLGGRLDEHSFIKKPIFSPRVTLRYNPIEDINLRASYAKGFRAPQVFDEDLHVGIVNGEMQRVINAVDLKPETSHAFTASADIYGRFGEVNTNLMIEGFYNRIINVFNNNEMESQNDGIMRYERRNGPGAHVFGLNLEGRLNWTIFQLSAGMSFAKARYEEAAEWGLITKNTEGGLITEGGTPAVENGKVVNESQLSDKMMRTPSMYGYFTLQAEPIEHFKIAINGNVYGSMYAPHTIVYGAGSAVSDIAANHDAEKFASYFEGINVANENRTVRIDELKKTPIMVDFGARISYEIHLKNHRTELYLGMNNIFDSRQKDYDLGPDRDSAYIYGPLSPRTAFFGVKYSF